MSSDWLLPTQSVLPSGLTSTASGPLAGGNGVLDRHRLDFDDAERIGAAASHVSGRGIRRKRQQVRADLVGRGGARHLALSDVDTDHVAGLFGRRDDAVRLADPADAMRRQVGRGGDRLGAFRRGDIEDIELLTDVSVLQIGDDHRRPAVGRQRHLVGRATGLRPRHFGAAHKIDEADGALELVADDEGLRKRRRGETGDDAECNKQMAHGKIPSLQVQLS